MDKVAEQQAIVDEYIEDARSVIEDPEAGHASLSKVGHSGAQLLTSVSEEAVAAINRTTDTVNRMKAAEKDPHCSAGKVRGLEKKVKQLETEHEAMKALYARLSEFMDEVQARLHEYEPEQEESKPQAEVPSRPETPKKLPWWKRLLGVHQAQAPEPRESSVKPFQVQVDREDYEKLLTWYEQNLEVLEKAVAGSQRLGEPGDWQSVFSELLDNMAWCDRNMDAIEQRNAEIAVNELVSRRKDLAARRDELERD